MTTDIPTFYGQTMPGFEKIAWLELKKRLRRPKLGGYVFAKDQNGVLLFNGDYQPDELLQLRTLEDVFRTVIFNEESLSRDWGDLRRLTTQLQEDDAVEMAIGQFRNWFKHGFSMTYRVIARKHGNHAYRRKDVREAVETALDARYMGLLQRVEDDADCEVWVNILGSTLLCGLRLSDRTMRHRGYQSEHVTAALRPSAAAAMVTLANSGENAVVLDPMCGSGTLMIERALAGPAGQILGGDIDGDRLAVCQENLQNFAADAPVGALQCSVWDAGKLPLAAASVDQIITNPPFGKKIGDRKLVLDLYPALFAEAERVLRPGGRMVVISSEYEQIKQILRQHPTLVTQTGYSVALLGQWARVYIIDKG